MRRRGIVRAAVRPHGPYINLEVDFDTAGGGAFLRCEQTPLWIQCRLEDIEWLCADCSFRGVESGADYCVRCQRRHPRCPDCSAELVSDTAPRDLKAGAEPRWVCEHCEERKEPSDACT